ncbi:30S ribosomal protein S9 [Candidatus Uhrbacteria bacterium CG10_big_fil_rev_8_21_14_0_10_48_11]|uniref:Small ribosomal subunit protein uS9 n=1 Tax=Candidatus Uhrbacteria bacterium CG10_big_fil_rev_8_21_14_0_10_48_11 TaxID=1975037 RepID=A0A2M8LEE2_9BACT|nr:MAG: 30S ribosomal protein S9 [Candidatus Uhrbacteria bacterium CG10_big_fil_rev_8_21_14_0_10_48_11]
MPTTSTKTAKKPLSKPVNKATVKEPRNFIQTVGRRKSAVARVRLHLKGKGVITVNGKKLEEYFPHKLQQEAITAPLPLVGMNDTTDITVKVAGGGMRGQAEAIRLGVARALVVNNEEVRPTLRKMGWLTRDPRVKERKKPGLKGARRAPQWQKR